MTIEQLKKAINKRYPFTFYEPNSFYDKELFLTRGKQETTHIRRLSEEEKDILNFIDKIIYDKLSTNT